MIKQCKKWKHFSKIFVKMLCIFASKESEMDTRIGFEIQKALWYQFPKLDIFSETNQINTNVNLQLQYCITIIWVYTIKFKQI